MKNRKLLKTWGLLASTTMLVPLVAGSLGGGPVAEAAPLNTTTDITIHKLVFDELPAGITLDDNGRVTGEIKNDGSATAAEDYFDDDTVLKYLEDAEFTMYDVTEKYWSTINTEIPESESDPKEKYDMDATFELIKDSGTSYTVVNSGRTDEFGQVTFEDVADYETDEEYEGKNKVYLIVETDAPPFTSNWSQPIVVMLPFHNEADEVVEEVHLFPKNLEVGFDKSLTGGTTQTIEVNGETINYADFNKGAEINYNIEFMMPLNINANKDEDEKLYTQFDITDTPTENLKYKSLGTPVLEVFDGPDWTAITDLELGTDYTVVPSETDGGFTVSFQMEDATLDKLGDYAGQQVRLNYVMTLTEDAEPQMFEDNTATITFEHNGNTITDTDPGEKVTTGGHHFYKYDGSKGNNETAVADAEFIVGRTVTENETTTTEYAQFTDAQGELITDATDTKVAATITWTTDKANATIFKTPASGEFSVEGLAYGSYFVEEIKAAPGFVLPNDPITNFEVNENSYLTTMNDPTELSDPENIVNYPKGTLPSTGGTGIFAFLAIGTALMMGAYLWFKNSKKQEV